MAKRAPWGRVSRHCVYCREVGPRVVVHGGFAHRRCIPKEPKNDAPKRNKIGGCCRGGPVGKFTCAKCPNRPAGRKA